MKLSTIFSQYALVLLLLGCEAANGHSNQHVTYKSNWARMNDGHFLGSDIWPNPMQDWRINNKQLECYVSGGERNVFLLTRELSNLNGSFNMEVTIRPSATFLKQPKQGYVGFRVGVKGKYGDYRDAAVRGRGMKIGVDNSGHLFIGNKSGSKINLNSSDIKLRLTGNSLAGSVDLSLHAFDSNGNEVGTLVRSAVEVDKVAGGMGLVCHAGDNATRERKLDVRGNTKRAGNTIFSFKNWSVAGDIVETKQERKFGPIAFSLYTVNDATLKVTAQMFPVPKAAGSQVTLELKDADQEKWQTVDKASILEDSRTAHFRLENWRHNQSISYRIGYPLTLNNGSIENYYYEGVISKEPKAGSKLKVASLSCHLDLGFPHQDMVSYIKSHDTDLALFTGDQYYEGNAGYGVQVSPLSAANLDYLRKWYQFGWAFRDIYRNVPSIFLVDDHDVFHGNIWGEQGKAASGKPGADIQDSGGFKMPAPWVNAVQRSMTSHMPDAFDPNPVQQNISVYFTELNYAGVSFAIVEDRKWKSSPRQALPKAKIVNGFSRNLEWDAKLEGDIDGLSLLGERQMRFLDIWSKDWSKDARMKAVVSQTLFSSVQTRPRTDITSFKDRGMQASEIGTYPEDDITVQDFDTNGWPQTPRKNALKLMKRASSFHIAGDTHLGVTFQYGIDGWNNGPWAIGSPAISNVWPRRWLPKKYPFNYIQNQPRNLGEYFDGFGNEITVRAVANPTKTLVEPVKINERAPGYNILTFDTAKQTLKVEAWPRWIDPLGENAEQFSGWPIVLNQTDNGYPTNGPKLPTIYDLPSNGAVVQVINEVTNSIEYTLRFTTDTITPNAFTEGVYTIRLFDANMTLIKELKQQKTLTIGE